MPRRTTSKYDLHPSIQMMVDWVDTLYREHVFAQIKPSTKTRLDLGLCLTPLIKDGKKTPPRLIDTGGFKKKDRVTHRIELGSVEEFDDQARLWLSRAYELDV